MTTFTTRDRRSHIIDQGRYDGTDIVRIVHFPIVGECAEFELIGGRYALTGVVATMKYS